MEGQGPLPIRVGSNPQKKPGVVEHLQAFDHAGLLVNEPPGLSRVALHLVVRQRLLKFLFEPPVSRHRLGFASHCDARNENSK
jgi:hypothetical protein